MIRYYGPEHAFLWRKGVMKDLGTVAGTPNSQASFINSKTQIVGLSFACDFSVFNAILWENGSMVDLNTLIPPNSPFHLYSASFIDDRGQIAAFGLLPNFDSHAVLLIPCDENHPGIESCDYSFVDALTTADVRPAQANQFSDPGATKPQLSPSEMMTRFDSTVANRHRRWGNLPRP
jgi:probable HAF family extracellular repeat protein